jgi:asparagine synthase (glutamine-hydrolysing)
MMDRIKHRGPDMAGQYVNGGVALGFRRLSILDLSEAGAQPMVCEHLGRTYAMVFNGEIYNFREMRDVLVRRGHDFHSETDTEVLLHGYAEFGEQVLDQVRGMFAFVIWDVAAGKLFGARDFFGIKPLYYTRTENGEFMFASEIKSFLEHPGFVKELNKDALLPYLTFQYSAQDETFFRGVFKLPPAHKFSWDLADRKLTVARYADADYGHVDRTKDLAETARELDGVVRESVAAHRIADVQVGTFLSGGIDSSYITAAMMPDKTFSVGFANERFDETMYAQDLSELLGIENVSKVCGAEECFAALPTIQYHMDEPQSNPSAVPLYFLAQLARRHVTVVLSGEGADEIFAGYEWYNDTDAMRRFKHLPGWVRRVAARVAEALPPFRGRESIIRSSGVPENFFIGHAHVFDEKEAAALVREAYRGGLSPREITRKVYARVRGLGDLEKRQYLDLNLWQPGDILLKADKMSMAHSLELRVPFLDKHVMAFAQKLPAEHKVNAQNTKVALRAAASEALPEDWAQRTKLGFPVPIRLWLREEKYYKLVRELFNSAWVAEFFDVQALLTLVDDHYHGVKQNQRKIWTVYTFLTWYKRFFIDETGIAAEDASADVGADERFENAAAGLAYGDGETVLHVRYDADEAGKYKETVKV